MSIPFLIPHLSVFLVSPWKQQLRRDNDYADHLPKFSSAEKTTGCSHSKNSSIAAQPSKPIKERVPCHCIGSWITSIALSSPPPEPRSSPPQTRPIFIRLLMPHHYWPPQFIGMSPCVALAQSFVFDVCIGGCRYTKIFENLKNNWSNLNKR